MVLDQLEVCGFESVTNFAGEWQEYRGEHNRQVLHRRSRKRGKQEQTHETEGDKTLGLFQFCLESIGRLLVTPQLPPPK